MAYKFNDEDKVETSGDYPDRLPFGINTVKLVGAVASETDAGKDFIELTGENADGIEESARVWFTGGASVYSFNTIKQIIVHHAKTDGAKEKARQAAENCVDTDAMANLLNDKCVGAEFWITKYFDPTRTYQNKDGNERRSINTNVYGYQPNEKPDLLALTQLGEAAPDVVAEVNDDDDVTIPDEWDN